MPRIRDLCSRTKLVLTGEDRVRFLHGMVTNDVEALAPGQGCHAAMLTTKGKMVANLVIYCDADALFLELDASLREKVKQLFDKHIIMDDVEVHDATEEERELGVYGDDAAASIERAIGLNPSQLPNYGFLTTPEKIRVARAPELGIPGFHIFGSVEIVGELLGDDEFEEARIAAGTPIYGIDMGEDRLPIEAGVTDAVSFTKGCYLGQEVIARATNLGHINKKLVGLVIEGEAPVARSAKLTAASRPEAGIVTSSVNSRAHGGVIALAYVHRTLWDPGTALDVIDPAGGNDSVKRHAKVVTLPFTRT